MIPRLCLFDIDGTLVRCGGAGRRALERSFEEHWGLRDTLQDVVLDGATDSQILATVFARSGRPWLGLEDASAIIERYLRHLEQLLAAPDTPYSVLGGASGLLARSASASHLLLGVATGNVEAAARLKLRAGGLADYFACGGYGSDAVDRGDIVRVAHERGQALAEQRFGRQLTADEVIVIGDTERDVAGARAAGVRVVGVLRGSTHPDRLIAARPDLVAESLEDPALLAFLDL